MKKSTTKLLVLLLTVAFYGCRDKVTLNENLIPETLVIGVFAGESEGPEGKAKRLSGVEKYIEKKLGIDVTFVMTTDYTSLIEALRAKKVHMADLPPFAYVLAKENIDIQPLVSMGVDGKPYRYRGAIVASLKSGVKNMEDLKAKASTLTLCFPDPASASGHLLPRAYLTSIGLNPELAFKQTIFSSSHTASMMSVKSGKIDIGGTAHMAVPLMVEKGMMKEGDVVVLWVSEPVASNALVIRTDINKDFAIKVQQAYLTLIDEDPDAWEAYLKIYGLARKPGQRFIVAYDSMYDGIRKISSGLEGLYSNSPGTEK